MNKCSHVSATGTSTSVLSYIFVGLFLIFETFQHCSPFKFDVSRHLARGDVIFGYDSSIILVKWSKTDQLRNKVARISIPSLPGTPFCAVTALKALLILCSLSLSMENISP